MKGITKTGENYPFKEPPLRAQYKRVNIYKKLHERSVPLKMF